MSTIGMRLKQERVRIGLTQRELGRVGGVKVNAQGAYELDKRSPRADYLAKILTAGVDVIYVLTGKPVPPSGPPDHDGVAEPLDSVFNVYLSQSELLSQLSAKGAQLARQLEIFCQNQLTVIAALKYLVTVAEAQGYDNVPSWVDASLKALNGNAAIIAEVLAGRLSDQRGPDEPGAQV
ncbi:helix-turn-helix domain-containing protein [Pseudomonas sp. DSP3-2-2]|uniref:helix-turn-helix domain-containing protein n=1 Tax=unclassified Pseudomonas TaxID=196821 RepID=UPI003CEDC9CE